jgi:hypothetical protein
MAFGDVVDRQRDGVRMRQQRFAIAGVRERGAPLQRLETDPLVRARRTDHNAQHLTAFIVCRRL